MAGAALSCADAGVIRRHASLDVVDIPGKGRGWVCSRGPVSKGELLVEEIPFSWKAGSSLEHLAIAPGVNWLLESGNVHELSSVLVDDSDPPQERAEAIVAANAFRSHVPDQRGDYIMFLFGETSIFNHSCFPNAGASFAAMLMPPNLDQAGVVPMRTYALEDIAQGEEACVSYLPVELLICGGVRCSPGALNANAPAASARAMLWIRGSGA